MDQSADAAVAFDPNGSVGAREGDRPAASRFHNLPQARLVEHALARGEGVLSHGGAMVFLTGKYTGRSPKDKFLVRDDLTAPIVDWGPVNQAFEPADFDALERRVLQHLAGRDAFVLDAFGGTDPAHRIGLRVVCERAYHALFARQLFVTPTADELADHHPEFTILAAPDFQADPARDRTRSEVFIILNLARKTVLIGGTLYAGEIKKSVFSLLNTLLPLKGVMPMHCSANIGARGDVALFFGLSGTGKTTLSADPNRRLIGDDEHGWSDDGVFNFEGGCYAKCIRLNRLNEPEIYEAIKFGAVLENVILDPVTRVPDFADASLTENTRAAYPIEFIPNYVPGGRGGHPSQVVFLTCDAFGVLPPVARLRPEQAMYHFLSGYTAKVAGTERGLGNEPQATFSTCFGAPFMTLPPGRYAALLGDKLRAHKVDAWLLNTGWTGGAFGVGTRISLPHTRALVDAIMTGTLANARFATDPVFELDYPIEVPGVPTSILNPRSAWPDPAAYDRQAEALARLFRENFTRFATIDRAIAQAGPVG